MPPEALIEHAFSWAESLYGEAYWKSIYARVSAEATKSKDEVVQGLLDGYTFERLQDKLETFLKVISYRRASLHADDLHSYVSRDRSVKVATSNGYVHIRSQNVSAHSIIYRDVKEIKLVDDTIIMTLQSGSVIMVS